MGYTKEELYEKLNRSKELTGGNLTKVYGRSLNQPFASSNSAYRGQMFSIHQEHALVLTNPDRAFVSTGHETRMSEHSSVFKRADTKLTVIAKIQKYPSIPNHHYWLIVKDEKNKRLEVIERTSYRHTTESFGYLYNNELLDNLVPETQTDTLAEVSMYVANTEYNRQVESSNSITQEDWAQGRSEMIADMATEAASTIYPGEVYKKSTSFDSANNYCMGLNMLVAYVDKNQLTEDPVVMSRSAAARCKSAEIKPVQIKVNENDIFVNCHGDISKGVYKPLPDVGEEIGENTLYCLRRENKEDALFTQSIEQLSKPMMSDETTPLQGMVVDIDVHCNNPSGLDIYYNQQLKYYWENANRYCEELVSFVDDWSSKHPGYSMTHDLEVLYDNFKRRLEGVQFINDDKPFNNIVVDVVVVELCTIATGDKVANRYGGKGVVAKIVDDEKMPKLNGRTIDVMWRSSTGINRENAGQYKENLLTSIGYQILEHITDEYVNNNMSDDKFMEQYLKYLDIVNANMASQIRDEYYEYFTLEQRHQFVQELINEKCIHVMVDPIYNNLTLKDYAHLMREFPYVHPLYLDVPIEDSKGNVRWVKSSRSVGVGYQYIMMLKQKANEKYSEASFSVVNIRGENSKDGNKQFKNLHKRTPVRFGHMENGSFDHIGIEAVITQMMLYGSSPTGRMNIGSILTGDPFDIDIKLTDKDVNRKAEIVACDLKGGMGLKLVINKIPKRTIKLKKVLCPFSPQRCKDSRNWERIEEDMRNKYYENRGMKPPVVLFADERKKRIERQKELDALETKEKD